MLILIAQDYILRVREILPEFWLALAEGVDGCWELKKTENEVWEELGRLLAIPSGIYQSL